MRRSYRIGLSALAVTAVVGGTVAFKALDKSVEVIVDGQPQTVSTYANTVSGVLNDAGLEVSKRDAVTPSLDSSISSGSMVNITRARMVDYTVDGSQNRQWVTALTVDEALDQLGIADNAKVSSSRSQRIPLDGATLQITTSKDITVSVDGQSLQSSSTSIDVQSLLTELGIKLEQQDTTDPALTTVLTAGMTVTVNRIRVSQVNETQVVDYATTQQEDASLTQGQSKTLTAGTEGEQIVTYNVTTTNGVETAREVANVTVTKAPVNKVVAIGTKPAPAPDPNPGSGSSGGSGSGGGNTGAQPPADASGLNWDALAQCEAGGNWAINTGNGYYGGLQFNKSTWDANGGGAYAAYPHQATKAQQIAIGTKLYNARGISPWPACGPKLHS